MDVAREYMHDRTRLKGFMEESPRRLYVKGVIGDGRTYDSRRNFNIIDEKGIEPKG